MYPEVTSIISESWQAGKWVEEVALDELTPMWADWQCSPDRHFYVNEVARTRDGRYLVPKRWIIYNGEEYADAQLASVDCQVRPRISWKLPTQPNHYDSRQGPSRWLMNIPSEYLRRS